MIVRLPVPPSTNNLFVNKKVGGRFISPAYKAWRTAAGWILQSSPREHFGTKRVQIYLKVPRKPASRDIDNFSKGPIDLCVAHNIIADDKQVDRLVIERHDDGDIVLEVRGI